MHWGTGWDGGDWVAMSLMMVAFWGLVVLGIVILLRSFGRARDDRTADEPTPGRILEERFARGEIDEDEFKKRRETLSART